MGAVGSYASKDVGDVAGSAPDFNGFSLSGDDAYARQAGRLRELEQSIARYESDLSLVRGELSVSRRETDNLRGLAQHLKVQTRDANQKRFAAEKNVGAFDRFMRDKICGLIEHGVNPLTGEVKGSYVFVNRHGKIASMSGQARKVLGYDDSKNVNYHELVPAKQRFELAEVRADATIGELPLKMAEGENIIVKDVHVSPLIVGGVYAGTIVDFRGLTLLEKARTAWLESHARKLIDETRAKFRECGADLGAPENA